MASLVAVSVCGSGVLASGPPQASTSRRGDAIAVPPASQAASSTAPELQGEVVCSWRLAGANATSWTRVPCAIAEFGGLSGGHQRARLIGDDSSSRPTRARLVAASPLTACSAPKGPGNNGTATTDDLEVAILATRGTCPFTEKALAVQSGAAPVSGSASPRMRPYHAVMLVVFDPGSEGAPAPMAAPPGSEEADAVRIVAVTVSQTVGVTLLERVTGPAARQLEVEFSVESVKTHSSILGDAADTNTASLSRRLAEAAVGDAVRAWRHETASHDIDALSLYSEALRHTPHDAVLVVRALWAAQDAAAWSSPLFWNAPAALRDALRATAATDDNSGGADLCGWLHPGVIVPHGIRHAACSAHNRRLAPLDIPAMLGTAAARQPPPGGPAQLRLGLSSAHLHEGHPIGALVAAAMRSTPGMFGALTPAAGAPPPPPLFCYDLSARLSGHADSHMRLLSTRCSGGMRSLHSPTGPSDGTRSELTLDDRAAALVRADGVHVLFDLDAHTGGSMAGMLTRRPAPAIIHLIGQPVRELGTGLADYFAVDRAVVDPVERGASSRNGCATGPRLLVLARSYYFGAHRPSPAGMGGAPQRRGGGRVLFASFTQAKKLDPMVFTVWCSVLRRVRGSTLMLSSQIRESAKESLLAEAAGMGVAPARFLFAEFVPSRAAHLRRLRSFVDVFLDAMSYNAGSAAVDALSEGVPLVTLEGSQLAARMGASLLTAASPQQHGRQQTATALVAHTVHDYEEVAVALGTRAHVRRAASAALIRANREASGDTAPLFDAIKLSADLVRAAHAAAEVTSLTVQRARLPHIVCSASH